MKKFALATLLALSTSAAFAGFNGNTAQGGFQGGNQGQQLTVKPVSYTHLTLPTNSRV